MGRATDDILFNQTAEQGISIHALRGEGDVLCSWFVFLTKKISIHALRGEGDPPTAEADKVSRISIHALRGEGDDMTTADLDSAIDISIHALRGEGDQTTQRQGQE